MAERLCTEPKQLGRREFDPRSVRLDALLLASYSFDMTKPKKPCPTCDGSGFVNVQRTLMTVASDGNVECVPCWSCDLGHKIEKAEAGRKAADH